MSPADPKGEQLDRSYPKSNKRYWCADSGLSKRTCKCKSCVAKRNRRLGRRKQGEERKKLEKHFGVAGKYASQTGNEETWRMRVRVEVKSGEQVDPIGSRFLEAEAACRRPGTDHFLVSAFSDLLDCDLWLCRSSELGATLRTDEVHIVSVTGGWDPVARRFLAAEGQSGAATATGDLRPFIYSSRPQNMDPDGLIIFRSSQLAEVLEALNE